MKSTGSWLYVLAVALAIVVVLAPASIAQAGPSGTIFTTDETGTFVNGNVYDSKDDVYLNGGPQPKAPCTAAGLPDGYYVFHVTDPSGAALLSSDAPGERVVLVQGGLIVPYVGMPVSHETGSGKCGSLTIQLQPFDDTTNPGGEYKVWMAPVDPNDPTDDFLHRDSKTDNFKVVPPEGPGD